MIIYYLKYIRTWWIVTVKRIIRLMDTAKSEEFVKFAIICSPRSGSTLLHTYLNSHQNILSHGEIIRRKLERGEEVRSIYEIAFTPQSKKMHAVGLKLFYDHKVDEKIKSLYQQIVEDRTIKIIHLKRKDNRNQLISLRRAEATGVWSGKSQKSQEFDLDISEEEITRFSEKLEKQMSQASNDFAEHDQLELFYEDLVDDPKEALKAVQQFIEVKHRPLFTVLQKQGEN